MKESNQEQSRVSICLLSGFIVETGDSKQDDDRLVRISNMFYEHMLALIYSEKFDEFKDLDFLGLSYFDLDPSTMNCRRCDRCHRWTTDIRRDDVLNYLPLGRDVDGRYICIQCEDAPNM